MDRQPENNDSITVAGANPYDATDVQFNSEFPQDIEVAHYYPWFHCQATF